MNISKKLLKIRNKKLFIVGLLCLAIILIFIINFGSILTSLGKFLIINEEPQKVDIIIILGGDGLDRVAYGAKLYQLGYADMVLLSGNKVENKYMKQLALSLGIPETSILQEDQSRTTFENAKYSLKIVQNQGYKSVIVVSSPFHTRRVSIIFSEFFKEIDITICPIPYDPTITCLWWKDIHSTKNIVSEYLKLAWHYLFEQYLR